MRKLILFVACLLCLCFLLPSGFVSAEETSKASLLMEYDSGEVLQARNELDRRPIASMVKIMSLLLTFENLQSGKLSLEDTTTVSSHAAGMGGSQVFLDAGKTYRVESLIEGVVVASANDACVALAEMQAGSEENFVRRMNERAHELGCENTAFTNCTGLPREGQYSCASDVARMLRALLHHPEYYRFANIWMDDFQHPSGRITQISNTNKLIRFYDGCDGGKTGYTSEAMHCVAATAKRGNLRFISVVVGACGSKERFEEAKAMFNYGFANYESEICLSTEPFEAAVSGAKEDTAKVFALHPLCVVKQKGETVNVSVKTLLYDLRAPLKKGEVVGKAMLLKDGEQVAETALVALEEVSAITYPQQLKKILQAR